MARSELQELYTSLVATEFGFMEPGLARMEDIYRAVWRTFPALCDNSYLCSMNCQTGRDQPEWMHATRRALAALKKSRCQSICPAGKRGEWLSFANSKAIVC